MSTYFAPSGSSSGWGPSRLVLDTVGNGGRGEARGRGRETERGGEREGGESESETKMIEN